MACAFTRDFVHFENDRDVSPKGYASPGDVVQWHGRWLLPYQSYPARPIRLCFSESTDLARLVGAEVLPRRSRPAAVERPAARD